jgi:hypothetical protein
MIYEEYIASQEWKQKRQVVLERDKFTCQTCLSQNNPEVHHKTYENFGNEFLEDLITLCTGCHEAITNSLRERRYSGRSIVTVNIQNSRIWLGEKTNVQKIELQDSGSIANNFTQRTNSRSSQQLLEDAQEDFRQTDKD